MREPREKKLCHTVTLSPYESSQLERRRMALEELKGERVTKSAVLRMAFNYWLLKVRDAEIFRK